MLLMLSWYKLILYKTFTVLETASMTIVSEAVSYFKYVSSKQKQEKDLFPHWYNEKQKRIFV